MPIKQKYASNFVKVEDIQDDFCNVERYTTVIWICQHSTSAFKKTFDVVLTQEFYLT